MNRVNRLVSINLAFILIIALTFWLGSRYPQLNEKAMMGGQMPVKGLSFDITQEVQDDDPVPVKILYHTINWIDTNTKGMTFGILFGAALLIFFNLMRDRLPVNRWYSTLLGVLIGSPLGVCVNCAAPIAKGMRDGGSSEETALATMITSPTMNFIVLTMLFSLLPHYMVVIKLSTTLLLVVFGLPVLTKIFSSKPSISQNEDLNGKKSGFFSTIYFDIPLSPSWLKAFTWFFKNYFKSFGYLIVTAVPLMLLAGLLGNILITIVPFEDIIRLLTVEWSSKLQIMLIMIGLGLMGAFLPVPMTFDVIIVVILHTAGLPPKYSMVLLFTLGSVSVYSYFITQQTFSRAIALTLFFSIVGLGVFNGLLGHYVNKFYVKVYEQDLLKSLVHERHAPEIIRHVGEDSPLKSENAVSHSDIAKYEVIAETSGYKINGVAYTSHTTNDNESLKPFENISSLDIGIDLPYEFSAQHILEPLARGGSIAAEDVNLDGWEDLLIVSSFQLNLYLNEKGNMFKYQNLEISDSIRINNAVLTDLNHDGWFDILFSSYYQGVYIIYNQDGQFFASNMRKLLDLPSGLVDAFGIGNLNEDAALDIVLGVSSYGGNFRTDAEILSAKNLILLNDGTNQYSTKFLQGASGETLSVLVADLNQDQKPDVVVGNDFYVPDYVYLGDQQADTLQHTQFKFIESQTRTTMSVSIADINNDLEYEIFEVQSGFIRNIKNINTVLAESPGIPVQQLPLIEKILSRKQQIRTAYLKRDFFECDNESDWDCIYPVVLRNAMYIRDSLKDYSEMLSLIPKDWWVFHKLYPPVAVHNKQVRVLEQKNEVEHPNTIFEFPVLLQKDEHGNRKDVRKEYGIEDSGWAWNAKFADLDNDQWQDLFIVNGFLAIRSFDSNIFYKNLNGEKFADLTDVFNLGNSLPIGAYTYFDYDHDGDIDIFMLPQVGPLLIYENQNVDMHNSIMFELLDQTSKNQFAIGAEIIIEYGKDQHQSRQILKSGGFKSTNPRVLHFGLGEIDQVSRVIINLPTGKSIVLNEELDVGLRYQIVIKG